MKIPPSKTKLDTVIIGAGIGGITAAVALGERGHNVTIYETAPELLPIGAGIQVAPNLLRLLDRWGVGKHVRAKGVRTKQVTILRWQNGKQLHRSSVDKSHGDQMVVHRADLCDALINRAKEMPNVSMRLGSTVVDINFQKAQIQLASGEKFGGDVILVADGIKSSIRTMMLGKQSHSSMPTGDACFRVTIPRTAMEHDEELRPFIDGNTASRWIGPDRHVIAYPVSNHQLYNIATAHPDRRSVDESWTTRSSKTELLKEFQGWEPRLTRMFALAPEGEILEWKLCSHPPLQTWVQGRVALMGDACHPMLPYMAQGAAQAVEDAAALGVLLSSISSALEVPKALKVYEQSRKGRAETIQALSNTNRNGLHLHDGPEQEARDQQFADISTGKKSGDKWADEETRRFLWDWDSEKAAWECWQEAAGKPISITVESRL